MAKTSEKLSKKKWQEQLEKFKQLPPPIIERQDECFHIVLKKIGLKDGISYQCQDCQTIFDLFGVAAYSKEIFLKKSIAITEDLQDG